MLVNEKIIQIRDNTLFDDIEAYLNELEVHSKGTRAAYETDIKQFFKTIVNKEIEYLTIEELQSIKKKDVINYRKHLMDNFDLANSTINNKITAPRNLYLFLSSDYDVNANIFNIKSLKIHHNSYGSLSQTEAERFAETAFQTEREKPFLKKMMILFAIRTSFRLNEILNVKWSDFEYSNGVYKVTTMVGKGKKKNTTAISEKFYNEILKLKEINKETKWNKDENLVFQISVDSVNSMMDRLRLHLGIEKSRNIVFHSFRGVAVDWILENTNGNITEAAIHANHSNPATTFKHYVNKTKDYSQSAGVRMEEEIDLNFLEKMTIEDFKDYVKNGDYRLQLDLKKFMENR